MGKLTARGIKRILETKPKDKYFVYVDDDGDVYVEKSRWDLCHPMRVFYCVRKGQDVNGLECFGADLKNGVSTLINDRIMCNAAKIKHAERIQHAFKNMREYITLLTEVK